MSELYRDFIEDQFDRVVNAINNELPTPTQADIGKVVQVASDGGSGAEYVLDAVPNELPTPTTSDIDKVVKVISDGSGGAEYSLENESQELPTPTTADIGKFATVVSDGSGGAEYSLDSVPQELPTPASTNLGKVATVVSDGSGGYEWSAEAPNSLPAVTGSGHILGTNNGNWIEVPTTVGSDPIVSCYYSGSWRDYYLNMSAVASYYGSLSMTFSTNRSDFVTKNCFKNVFVNGMSDDYSKNYQGYIYCYGMTTNWILFKGIISCTGVTSGMAEVELKIDKTNSANDSLTVTPI